MIGLTNFEPTASGGHSGKKLGSDADLSRDRLRGIVAIVLFVALLALVVWLASLGVEPARMDYHYWLVP